MPTRLIFSFFLLFSLVIKAQLTIPDVLGMFNNDTVDYISVEELQKQDNAAILDTREKEEYQVSHLRNALWVGYDDFDMDSVLRTIPNKETPIVVYCSIGVRSEDIGEKLKRHGYSQVSNLYGGIFAWKDKGYPVYNTKGQDTEKVHAYSKYWGGLLTNAEKVYTNKTEAIGQEKQ